MTLPSQDEPLTAADNAHRHVGGSSNPDTASPIFNAAARGAKQLPRWFAAETEGAGPVSTLASKLAEGYQKSNSQLIEPLPLALEAALRRQIGSDEAILVKLKGQHKEALICTDQKVYVMKAGFLTGNTFGANVFQLPLTNVGSIDVQFGGASWQGRFELLALGASSPVRRQSDAVTAINCVTLYGPLQAQRFRNASSFILEKRMQALSPIVSAGANVPSPDSSPIAMIERLAELYDKGLLTREEFESQKQILLKRD